MKTTTRLGERVVPALLVRDMKTTLAFYAKLGFRMTGCYPPMEPSWAEVRRDSVTFQFHTKPPSGTPTTPVCSGTFYIYPDSVDALAEEYRGKFRDVVALRTFLHVIEVVQS